MNFLKSCWARLTGGDHSFDREATAGGGLQGDGASRIAKEEPR